MEKIIASVYEALISNRYFQRNDGEDVWRNMASCSRKFLDCIQTSPRKSNNLLVSGVASILNFWHFSFLRDCFCHWCLSVRVNKISGLLTIKMKINSCRYYRSYIPRSMLLLCEGSPFNPKNSEGQIEMKRRTWTYLLATDCS